MAKCNIIRRVECDIAAISCDITGAGGGDLVASRERQAAICGAEIQRIAFEVEIDVIAGLKRDIGRLAQTLQIACGKH